MEYTPKLGDVYVCSWGYDQTNVDAYVVTKVSPSQKSVFIQPCALTHEGEGHSTRLLPDPTRTREWTYGNRCGTIRKDGTTMKRVQQFEDGEPYLHLSSYQTAFLWNGQRTFYDTHAAGYPGH